MLVEKHCWKFTGRLVMVMRSPVLANWCSLKLGFHSPTQTRIQRVVFVAHSCLTLWDPMDRSWPGFSAHGILQARILGWMAMPSSRASCQHRDWTHVSHVSCTGRQLLYYCITWEAPRNSHHLLINIPVTKSSTNLPSLLQPFAWDL